MRFEIYFLLTSYAFASSGFLSLALTGRVDAVAILLFAGALGGSLFLEARHPETLLELKRARLLSVGYLPFFVVDAIAISPPFLVLTHFVLYMAAVKLFQRKQDSDWIWIYALTFFEVALAAALTINFSFLASLVLFLFTFVTTLAAFEIRRSHRSARRIEEETHASRRDRPRPLSRVRSLLSVASWQVVVVVVVAIPIFLFMPRFAGGALGSGFGEAQGITGFSDTVRFGDVTNIKQSDRPVMHVTLDSDPGRWLRWRGIALDTFDGSTWKASHAGRSAVLVHRTRTSRYAVGVPASHATDLIAQTIIVEGIDSPVLFAARRPIALDGVFSALTVDRAGNLQGPYHGGQRFTYTVYSDLWNPSEEALRRDVSTEYPDDLATRNLQLPRSLDQGVRELAQAIGGDASSPYDKARRIEAYLKEEFAYSLTPRRADMQLDPVTDFLLNTREGHCELFATGMVLMLRAEGIPARIVNGFQMGEYNGYSKTYRVRDRDAHSWVEVYFAGNETWIEFDPTPPGGINSYGDGSLTAQLRQSLEAMQIVWIRYVVGLDDREQISILRGFHASFMKAKAWTRQTAAEWKEWGRARAFEAASAGALDRRRMAIVVGGLMGLGLLAFTLFILRSHGWRVGGFVLPVWAWRSKLRGLNAPDEKRAVFFYEEMASLLAQHGVARRSDETPREFADRCGIDEVREITDAYHLARYGRIPQSPANLASLLRRLAARMRTQSREARRMSSAAEPPPPAAGK